MPWTTPETAVAGQVLTAAYLNTNLVANMNSLVEAGTALPSSPSDGQSFYYVADTTNGVVWHLRYRSASASAYKWEFVGGANVTREVLTNETTTTANTYLNLATDGPKFTVPLAGDYEVAWGATVNTANAAQTISGVAVTFGGTDPASFSGATDFLAFVSGLTTDRVASITLTRSSVKTALAANTEVKLRYRKNQLTADGFSQRFLKVRPVRVG